MILFLALCWLLFVYFYEKKFRENSPMVRIIAPYVPLLQNILLIGITVICGFRLIARIENGQCKSLDFTETWWCNPNKIVRGLPVEGFAVNMLLPIIYGVTLRDTKWQVLWSSWVIVIVMLLICVGLTEATSSLVLIILYIPASAYILYDTRGHYYELFLLNRRLQCALEENQKMAAKNRANEMRHMIGNIAHDLKSPLASFLSGLDTIVHSLADFKAQFEPIQQLVDPAKLKEVEECVASISTCASTMRDVNRFMEMTINRCIDFTKASQGLKLVPKHETISFREALELPMRVMKDMQKRMPIELKALPAEICSHIITDKQWLQENLLCLLSNAVKYSNGGSTTVSVTLLSEDENVCPSPCRALYRGNTIKPSTQHHRAASNRKIVPTTADSYSSMSQSSIVAEPVRYLRIEIEDTGIGLAQEAMDGLFNPFKQAQRLAGGTGLGLYSLAKRMEALNGDYGVQCRRDGAQGSLFWFAIPYRPDFGMAQQAAKNEDCSRDEVDLPPPVAAESAKLKILLVDDSVPILKMTSMMLAKKGHSVVKAENGAEAVEKWQAESFDLVLMDLQMPVMDGLEATRRIRELEKERQRGAEGANKYSASQLIISVSANSDNQTMEDSLKAGANAFMGKPFALATFNETLARFMGPRTQRRT